MIEQRRDYQTAAHPSIMKELGIRMLDGARDLVGFSPFVLPDTESCVAPVAGSDPFSASPDLSLEQRIEQALINDHGHLDLIRRLKR